MKFSYTGGTTLRFVWALLLVGTTSAMLTTLALGMTGQHYPGLNLPDTPEGQIVQLLLLIGLWALLGTPFRTSHEVRTSDLVLRQGILFRAVLPFSEIEEAHLGTRRPIGLGVRWYPGILFVVTWPSNLVEIRLKRRHVFRLLGIIPLPPVQTIAVNVDDPIAFLGTVQGGLGRD